MLGFGYNFTSWAALECLSQFNPSFIGLIAMDTAQNTGELRIQRLNRLGATRTFLSMGALCEDDVTQDIPRRRRVE
jgi:hypothetical protein